MRANCRMEYLKKIGNLQLLLITVIKVALSNLYSKIAISLKKLRL